MTKAKKIVLSNLPDWQSTVRLSQGPLSTVSVRMTEEQIEMIESLEGMLQYPGRSPLLRYIFVKGIKACFAALGKQDQQEISTTPFDCKNKKIDPTQPSHYRQGAVECIDAIRSALGKDGFCAYCSGNVLKYVFRWRFKNGVEDLKKAKVYLDWLIEAAAENQ